MKKIVYSNFTEFILSTNEVSTIDARVKLAQNSRIYCHAVDKLTNSSMQMINSRSTELVKPISCIMTLYVKINGVESIRTYDLSNYIGSNINFYVDLFTIKDVNGKTLLESGTITSTSLRYKNVDFTFTLNNSIKYKCENLSFYIKPDKNVDLNDGVLILEPEVIPMGVITNITPIDENDDMYMYYEYIPEVDNRTYDDEGWNSPTINIYIKRPSDSVPMISEFTNYGSPVNLWNTASEFFPGVNIHDVFVVGTIIKFQDGREIYGDTNAFVITESMV